MSLSKFVIHGHENGVHLLELQLKARSGVVDLADLSRAPVDLRRHVVAGALAAGDLLSESVEALCQSTELLVVLLAASEVQSQAIELAAHGRMVLAELEYLAAELFLLLLDLVDFVGQVVDAAMNIKQVAQMVHEMAAELLVCYVGIDRRGSAGLGLEVQDQMLEDI